MKKQTNTEQGFSLIELMITIVVLGCLAAISVPLYQDYVIRANLNEAFNSLLTTRALQERYFQDHRRYNNVTVAATTFTAPCNLLTQTTNFTYACTPTDTVVGTNTTSTFTITATGINRMSGFQFSIDNRNVQRTIALPSKWGGIPTGNCWVKRKGQSSC